LVDYVETCIVISLAVAISSSSAPLFEFEVD
jgi:hypothetical protein